MAHDKRKRVVYAHSDQLVIASDALPANEGRASLVHELVSALGLIKGTAPDQGEQVDTNQASTFEPCPATRQELARFHDTKYISEQCPVARKWTSELTPLTQADALLGRDTSKDSDSDDSSSESGASLDEDLADSRFRLTDGLRSNKRRKIDHLGLEDDCPKFPQLHDYVTLVAGASIEAARLLRDGHADVAISWHGGRHHGARGQATGFCYVQDVVLAILEMRTAPKRLPDPPSPPSSDSETDATPQPVPPRVQKISRVMYIDFDLHHGDGVEAAFISSPHVLTLSVHHHAPGFFPATGALTSSGPPGTPSAHHALNMPVKSGLSSSTLLRLFETCIEPVFRAYAPDAIVLQCGADGLAGDPCKEGNLDLKGFGQVVERVLRWGKRTLLLGGGGYNHANVARCWSYLTSIALERPLNLDAPLPASLNPATYETISRVSPTLDIAAGVRSDLNTEYVLNEIESAFAEHVKVLRTRYKT